MGQAALPAGSCCSSAGSPVRAVLGSEPHCNRDAPVGRDPNARGARPNAWPRSQKGAVMPVVCSLERQLGQAPSNSIPAA